MDPIFIEDELLENYLETCLFDRNLSQLSTVAEIDRGAGQTNPIDTVDVVYYDINNHGYRSDEFDKDNEVLVLGCSQTFGTGIPNNFTWPDLVCKYLNKKYSRLAIMGDSAGGQVYKAFKYFEEIGNPKIILALLPLYRMEYVLTPGKFEFSTGNSLETKKDEAPRISVSYFYEPGLLKFSKAPHDPSRVIPKNFVLFYNFMFVKFLEQYCESNNIKLIWSFYEDDEVINSHIKQNSKNVLKNYINTSNVLGEFQYLNNVFSKNKYSPETNLLMKNKHKECHKDFKDNVLYNWAADYDGKTKLGHWGIHVHQHIAEKFVERYEQIKND
jgi:hypothetical protein